MTKGRILKCGQWTTWFDIGMGFLVADDITGQPLK